MNCKLKIYQPFKVLCLLKIGFLTCQTVKVCSFFMASFHSCICIPPLTHTNNINFAALFPQLFYEPFICIFTLFKIFMLHKCLLMKCIFGFTVQLLNYYLNFHFKVVKWSTTFHTIFRLLRHILNLYGIYYYQLLLSFFL